MEVGKVLPQWSITEVYNPLYRKVIKTKTEGDEKYYSTPKS